MPRGPALWPDCSSLAKQKTVTAVGRPHALVWPRSRASDPTTAFAVRPSRVPLLQWRHLDHAGCRVVARAA